MITSMVVPKDTILVIAGNESSRQSLHKGLSEAGYEVLAVSNEPAVLDAIQQATPSLIVVDRQACNYERLRQQKALRTVPIIALEDPASSCTEDDCVSDIERGADLVLCNESTRQLIARVRAILRRKQSGEKQALHTTAGGVQMDLDRHEVRISGQLVDLTPKEFQILRHFLESPSRVFSRQEMLNCVWGEGYALEEHALDVHIHSLRQKIEENPAKPKLIVTVRGVGYKLRTGS